MATAPHEGSSLVHPSSVRPSSVRPSSVRPSSLRPASGDNHSFWTRQVGLRAGGEAPRWVVVLAGLMTGFGMIAVETHEPGRLIALLFASACLIPLLVQQVGLHRRQSMHRES